MTYVTNPNIAKIAYSYSKEYQLVNGVLVRQHVFDYILSGSSTVYFNGKRHTFKKGELRFIRKDRLIKYTQNPSEGEYRSIYICVDQDTLVNIQKNYAVKIKGASTDDSILLLKQNELFTDYIDSLIPYLKNRKEINNEIVRVKVEEAVMIFMEANPEIKNILFDFRNISKVDLETFMEEHFQFDGDLINFAYLTGRSLSTFKRDFKKAFHTSPRKWLIRKRLEKANILIKEKKIKPMEAAIEAGFKDYSHFSYALKGRLGALRHRCMMVRTIRNRWYSISGFHL